MTRNWHFEPILRGTSCSIIFSFSHPRDYFYCSIGSKQQMLISEVIYIRNYLIYISRSVYTFFSSYLQPASLELLQLLFLCHANIRILNLRQSKTGNRVPPDQDCETSTSRNRLSSQPRVTTANYSLNLSTLFREQPDSEKPFPDRKCVFNLFKGRVCTHFIRTQFRHRIRFSLAGSGNEYTPPLTQRPLV